MLTYLADVAPEPSPGLSLASIAGVLCCLIVLGLLVTAVAAGVVYAVRRNRR